MIAIIDYGAGNLHSVKNALDYLGADSVITDNKDVIGNADKVILPGVGAFGEAMNKIREKNILETVSGALHSGKPFLGICLGLQLLFEESDESKGVRGISYFKGKSEKIPYHGLKIPHIGWNSLSYNNESKLFHGIGNEPYVYFVHSYYIRPENEKIISACTNYGEQIPVAAEADNVYAVQFHPEKSGKTGLKILSNFANEI